MVSFSFAQNAYIVHELYFEIPAFIKWVITEVLTDVDDAHTHRERENWPPLVTRRSLARAADDGEISRACCVWRQTLRGGFRLMSLGTTREERLHRRFSCSCRLSSRIHAVDALSPRISTSFSGTNVMRCSCARARRPWSCARSRAERWTTTPSIKTAANSSLSRLFCR